MGCELAEVAGLEFIVRDETLFLFAMARLLMQFFGRILIGCRGIT
jgi:hypothetical protein